MSVWFNDEYVKVPEELGFAPCLNEFIKDNWNNWDYTIFIKKLPLGNTLQIYDEVHKCSLMRHPDGRYILSMKSPLVQTPLVGLFVKLCASENQGSW